MCSICKPILGNIGGIPHNETQCALKQGCFCPVCGPSTHLPRFCPKKSHAVLPRNAKPIESLPPIDHPPSLIMADTNDGYIEYLKQNGLTTSRKISENKKYVQNHLESREPPYILLNTPVEAERKIKIKRVK